MINLEIGKKIQVSIVSVYDGDTMLVKYNNQEFTTRAQWIDAPETQKSHSSTDPQILNHWKWGQTAKKFLESTTLNRNLIIIPIEVDIYGRWVADWYLDKVALSKCVQLLICREGFSTVTNFRDTWNFTARELSLYVALAKACSQAYQKKIGVFEPNFILPRDFKKLSI